MCSVFYLSFPLRIESNLEKSKLYEFEFGKDKIHFGLTPLLRVERMDEVMGAKTTSFALPSLKLSVSY
jgi:hypothetical protein